MMPAPSAALIEKRQQFATKQKELADAFELAQDGSQYDFSRKPVLEKLGATDSTDAAAKVKARNVELDNLGAELQQAEFAEINAAIKERDAARDLPMRGGKMPTEPIRTKSFGELFVESKEFTASRQSKTSIPVTLDIGMKTLFETAAGFAPESVRTGRLVEAVTRPVQVLDLIPSAPIGSPVEKYMEETTRTHASAEKAEGVTYAESTFVWTEKTSDVRKITDSIPVTDEQLEDEMQVRSILDQRLRFGLMQRLDLQVLAGNGTAPNLRGVINVVGIQTQAKGTDPVISAFLKALTKVRFTGRANPGGAVFHPNDWQDVLLTQNSNGDYLFGNPFMGPGPQSLFGIPVALSDALTENTGLVGDWANFSRIGERRGIDVQVGFSGTQFVEGKQTLRADLRACFTVYRPAAFCTLTGI
jgi:HK97 family phage major capsid protein